MTIYSSLPLQGAARAQAEAAVDGAKLALEQAGGKVGKLTIQYTSLDDSTAQAGGWDPGQTSSNARKAAGDESTIGYIGEFNSGATAVSLPLLNEAGIPQVSPGNTAVGITSDDPGAGPGEPDKYYPTGKRTYARILPKDFDPKDGGLPVDVAKRVLITIPGVAPEEYPPAGKQFLKDFEAKYGEKNPDRYAVYGYESMSLILDAIKRAGEKGDDRAAVLEQIFATKDREGVFGTYGIDKNGDITLTPYGVYRIKDGQTVFDRSVEPEGT
ncbi:MAG: ABC transporter substrate-binding protein [Solirubrobacterales bacterium]|nr:ABC transporter substrate-binding protein [Solirubrobacterales bacterium]